MRTTFLIAMIVTANSAAFAQEKITIGECLMIMTGLNALDGHSVVTNKGKPTEQVVVSSYEFGNGKLRENIGRNIEMIVPIQRNIQAQQQKIVKELGGAEMTPTVRAEFDRQIEQAISQPCPAELVRIKRSDLKLDRNEIPGSVLAVLGKILD